MPETDTSRARRRRAPRHVPSTATDAVAIEVAPEPGAPSEPSELEVAVMAAAAGYRFGEIEVPATIARAIEQMGFVTPTEVQARAIPPLRRGEDLIGQAQTGTGKTAAFGIPIVEKIEPSSMHVQALVLTPTRELCVQVTDEIARLGQFRGVRTVAIYGGSSMDKQIEGLKRGAQVVIGTPGRVLDLIRRGELRLDRVNTVILDEADRMLDMGFIVDVETILSRAPRQRQTALFSATMPYAILRICDRFMKRDPAHVTVRPDLKTVETVRQVVYFVAEQDKVAALLELTDQFGFDRLLVFRHTQIGVDRLAATLQRRGKNVAGPARRPVAARARPHPRGLPGRQDPVPDRDERRQPRARHHRPAVRRLVRHPRGRRHVRPPHRPHRPRRQGGDRHHLRRRVGPRRLGGHPRRGRRQRRGRPAQPLRPDLNRCRRPAVRLPRWTSATCRSCRSR